MHSDLAAENGVLSCILNGGVEVYVDISDSLSLDAFTSSNNRNIYECIKYIFSENNNAQLSISSIISVANTLGLTIDKTAFGKLYAEHIGIGTVLPLVKKLRILQITRNLDDKLNESRHLLKDVKGTESVLSIIGMAENPILDYTNSLSANNDEGITRMGDGVEEWLEFIEENPRDLMGLSSGYPRYDKVIGGGFRRQTVNVIGARTGIGKTLVSDNIALYNSCKGIPVLMLDTEMSKEGHWPRVLSILSSLPIDLIETGKFSKNEYKKNKVHKAVETLKAANYHYKNVSGADFDEIVAIMRRWVNRYVGLNKEGKTKDCLIIYDYLKLMGADAMREMAEFQVLGFHTTKLHDFSVKYDLPILTFVQLNRDGINNETSAAISASDRIAWLVSSLCIFKVKSQEEIQQDGLSNGNRKLVHIKSRFGGGLADGDYINLQVLPDTAKIVEGKTRNEVQQERNNQSTTEGFAIEESA